LQLESVKLPAYQFQGIRFVSVRGVMDGDMRLSRHRATPPLALAILATTGNVSVVGAISSRRHLDDMRRLVTFR